MEKTVHAQTQPSGGYLDGDADDGVLAPDALLFRLDAHAASFVFPTFGIHPTGFVPNFFRL